MKIIDERIQCNGRSDRLEIFPFGDCHIGKRNCNERAIKQQVSEVLRRAKMPNRHVRVLLGGDVVNAISPSDVRRFDFRELADWLVQGDAENTRDMLCDMVSQEVGRAVRIFTPIRQYIIGAISGNHENMMMKKQNVNVHRAICENLGIRNLTDEAFIRLKFYRRSNAKNPVSATLKVYIRHGYGGGRTAGAEPNKLARMMDEWEDADVSLTGHTHTYCIAPPKPVLYVPDKGRLPERLLTRHRFAANWGCWLLSHLSGDGSYESAACYPARPMMTLKIVVWPFWSTERKGKRIEQKKIELREYPLL